MLACDINTSDTIVGFHAQQAVEKYLKALLCHLRLTYGRTHDLVVLLDALADGGLPAPAEVDSCKYLQPYAVRFRYDDVPIGRHAPIDRDKVQRDVTRVRQWVDSMIAGASGKP